MTTAIHWAGPILVAGAVLLAIGIVRVSMRPVIGQVLDSQAATLVLLAAIQLLLALPAVYAFQADTVGLPGLVAHALLSVGVVLLIVVAATPVLFPSLDAPAVNHPLLFALGIALTLGLLLTGIVTIQGGVFPPAAAGLILAAMGVFAFSFFVAEFLPPIAGQVSSAAFGVLLATGLAWMGVVLWQQP